MSYQDALKKIQASKPKENMMAIRLSYDCTWLLPWKDGLAFMAALANAEQLNDSYSDKPKIASFDSSSLTVSVLPTDRYQNIKIAALLNVNLSDVLQQSTAA